MSDKKIHFVSSDNKAAKKAKDSLVEKYKDYSAPEADVIVALGGDGLMLQTLHDNIDEAIRLGFNWTMGLMMKHIKQS